MIRPGEDKCPKCSSQLKYYDTVKRIARAGGPDKPTKYIRRMKCTECGSVHRELPDILEPFKHYESELINKVVEGLITCDSYGFEDYPSAMTARRWKEANTG